MFPHCGSGVKPTSDSEQRCARGWNVAASVPDLCFALADLHPRNVPASLTRKSSVDDSPGHLARCFSRLVRGGAERMTLGHTY